MKQRLIAPGALMSTSISSERQIIVIGAGFGGLATAIRLQAAGCQVTLVEAQEHLGGRASQLQMAGFTFDMGPTLITAPALLEDLWHLAGRDLAGPRGLDGGEEGVDGRRTIGARLRALAGTQDAVLGRDVIA